MNFAKLSDMYKKPSFYTPPKPEQLTNNAEFPNLNSLEYRVKKIENTELKPQNFWEILEVDTLGQIVLVTNDYTTRFWTGSFWGYENFDDVGSKDKAVYSKGYDHLITNFKFVEPNIVSTRCHLEFCSEFRLTIANSDLNRHWFRILLVVCTYGLQNRKFVTATVRTALFVVQNTLAE